MVHGVVFVCSGICNPDSRLGHIGVPFVLPPGDAVPLTLLSRSLRLSSGSGEGRVFVRALPKKCQVLALEAPCAELVCYGLCPRYRSDSVRSLADCLLAVEDALASALRRDKSR